VFHRHELGHVICIEAPSINNLLTMCVDDLDGLSLCQAHRAPTPRWDNVKVCRHVEFLYCRGNGASILRIKDIISGRSAVKGMVRPSRPLGSCTMPVMTFLRITLQLPICIGSPPIMALLTPTQSFVS
jgi:hypothetical protein